MLVLKNGKLKGCENVALLDDQSVIIGSFELATLFDVRKKHQVIANDDVINREKILLEKESAARLVCQVDYIN